ncbi:Nnf1-domain-containing protein [Cladorrhinum samala]|uniref:Nnf1-domain-containing protein n=1 Tax=Cladorrhinum samala TaxID=585594 RepID=A0AAV9HCZ4_9PEZI|nr:Nnf1-domain-containing protein [Cladorrhinum samala]
MSNAPPPPPPPPPPVAAAPAAPIPPPPASDPTSVPPSSDQPEPEPEPEPESDEQKKQTITPGPRATYLQNLFSQASKHTLDKLSSPANFASCFPTIASKAPGTLDNVQRQMVDRLGGLWQREFQRILESRDVVRKLNELEGLVAEAQRRRKEGGGKVPVPPHTLPAETVLKAHLRQGAAELRESLQERLKQVQRGNSALFDEIRRQREEMEGMLKGVERVVGDLQGANEVLGGSDEKGGVTAAGGGLMDEVAAETRGAEADVEGLVGRSREKKV